MNDETLRKAIDWQDLIKWAFGLVAAGFVAWNSLNQRVATVETRIADARLSEVPQRLATIEATQAQVLTNQTQVLALLKRTEDDAGPRK